jgi:putative ABC transport system substrate-binding protein
MRRREFIAGLGGAAAWPVVGRAQQAAVPVIGFLGTESADIWASRLRAFRQGLGEAGYFEGKNVSIEYRWAQGQYNRLPALAADLLTRRVAVIAAPGSNAAALAAKATTKTIPIIFGLAADPIRIGLVTSLNRPGGNLTGVTTLNQEILPKRLELLHEVVPKASSFGLLVNPTNPIASNVQSRPEIQQAARILGLTLHIQHASTDRDFDSVLAGLPRLQAGGLLIVGDSFFSSHAEQLGALTLHHAIPAIYQWPDFASGGGLMSYGSSYIDTFRQVGVYTGRILKGEKPADLPVQQVTKIELIFNLKTAKALGLTIPETLLATADEVIQ